MNQGTPSHRREARGALAVALALTLIGCTAPQDRRAADERARRLYGDRARWNLSESADATADESVGAEASDAEVLADADLGTYVRFGLANSATLRAAFEEWRASVERIDQVSVLPEPRLSYTEFVEEVQTRTGPQERRLGVSRPRSTSMRAR